VDASTGGSLDARGDASDREGWCEKAWGDMSWKPGETTLAMLLDFCPIPEGATPRTRGLLWVALTLVDASMVSLPRQRGCAHAAG
jgi:hypothetical protein